MVDESTEQARSRVWNMIRTSMRAHARGDYAAVERANDRIDALLDRLIQAAKREGAGND